MSDERRVVGVTCVYSRVAYYSIAFKSAILYITICTLWLGIEPSGKISKYVYAILSAAMIPYLGMVIRCLFKDVPVPTYRLGVEGRENFFLAVMIIMYCISYNVQDRIRLAASIICLLLILSGASIVQLSCPIQDFTLPHILPTMYLGVMYGILSGIGTTSWSSFIGSLLFFPTPIFFMHKFFEEEERLVQPILES